MIKIVKASLKFIAIVCTALLSGCDDFLLFDPKGPIAEQQMNLIILSFAVMMIVVVPVFIMIAVFSIRYRESNSHADYRPFWEHSNLIEAIVWTIPIAIIVVLGAITYYTSHSLDPRQPIVSDKPTLRIQVVALDWKWLFIYPQQEIAAVNELAIPVDVPVEFLITSDTVMNAFFIPQLGSMIYAMAGMENQLHLIADEQGDFRGMSANYSGFGFSGMKFKALVRSENEFDQWVSDIKNSGNLLDKKTYSLLSAKTKDHPIEHYALANPLMFNRIIEKYTGEQGGQ